MYIYTPCRISSLVQSFWKYVNLPSMSSRFVQFFGIFSRSCSYSRRGDSVSGQSSGRAWAELGQSLGRAWAELGDMLGHSIRRAVARHSLRRA